MTTQILVNETFDPQGQLLSSETVEIEMPVDPVVDLVNSLTDQQRAALLAALQA